MAELRIIFMGTPDFAVPSLEILVRNNFNVVAVVTAPDKPQGRGQLMTASPVKICALKYNIPVLQPLHLKSEAFINELKAWQANLQVVVAFRMLPEVVWAMPPLGTFNLHASLLPQYRGAAPINWAIINGETATGVTTFFLRHEIDTGNIIFQEHEPIGDTDTAGTLYERLMHKGATLVLKTVQAIASRNFQVTPQTTTGIIRPAPKIFKDTCKINWSQPARQIVNFVRGLCPYPAAWTTFNDRTFKVFAASVGDCQAAAKPGELKTDQKNYLYVKSTDGWVAIDELQPEGKRRMNIQDFFRGNQL